MSDTCSLTLQFARKNLEKFNEVLKNEIWNDTFWDEDQGDEQEVMAIIYEANYGWYDQLQSLAKEGQTFTAEHGSGSEYGPCACACYQGNRVDVSTNEDGTPFVAAPNGKVSEKDLDNVRKYYEILEKIGGDTQ